MANVPDRSARLDWTPSRVEMLETMAAEGFTSAQIAAKLGGVTRSAVIGKASRLRIRLRATETWAKSDRIAEARREAKRVAAPKVARPPPPPKPPKAVKLMRDPTTPPPAIAVVGLGLAAMSCGQCRWPVNDWEPGEGHTALYCAADSGEATYCPGHQAVAFYAPKKSGRDYTRQFESRRYL
jgi:hypothetical protein